VEAAEGAALDAAAEDHFMLKVSAGAGLVVLCAFSYMFSEHLRSERRQAAQGTELERWGLPGIACPVMGCHLTQETRVQTRYLTWPAISARPNGAAAARGERPHGGRTRQISSATSSDAF